VTEKRYCIICGKEILSKDPDVVFCPEHGGMVQGEPSETLSQETTWEAEEKEVQPLRDVAGVWQPGQTLLDTYEVMGKLGEGGMGLVYRVHHNSWNMDLAVKQPKATLFATQKGKEDFIQEAETWVDLGLHPHITSCYYVRTIGDIPHIFVEFMAGGSLEDWIQRNTHDLYAGGTQQSLERILDIAIQFAWGLAYAHDCNLVHQDVKPLNVLMTPEGIVKVTDFGLAKARAKAGESAGEKDRRALVSGSLHTVAYRSPEQARGQMFEGGVYWYDGQSAITSLESYLGQEVEDDLPPIPEGLAELLWDCFQEVPDARPANMLVIADQIKAIYQDVTGYEYPHQTPEVVALRADSLNNQALSMLDLGNCGEATALFTKALQIDSLNPHATYNLGLYQWRRGEVDDLSVISTLEHILNTLPDPWPSAYLLGLIHHKRGDFKKAIQVLEMVEDYPETLDIINTIRKSFPGAGLSRTIKGTKVHIPGPSSLVCLPDSKRVLSGGDRSVKLWDIESGKCLRTYTGHKIRVNAVDISPDGRYALSGGGSITAQGDHPKKDNTVRLWDIESGSCLFSFNEHTRAVNTVAFSPDGKYALSGSDDHTLCMWDLQKKICLRTFEGHTRGVLCLAFSPDGKYALSGGDDSLRALGDSSLRLWDLKTGTCMHIFEGHQFGVSAVRFLKEGKQAISASKDGTLKLWNIKERSCEKTYTGHHDWVNDFSLHPCGKFMISASGSRSSASRTVREFTLRLWDIHSGECLRTFQGHTNPINAVDFSTDGRMVISGGSDYSVRLWNISDCIERDSAPFSIAIPISSEVASQQDQKFLSKTEQAHNALDAGHIQEALALIRVIRSMPGYERDEKAQRMWLELYQHCSHRRIKGGWLEKTFVGHDKPVKSVAFSQDGKFAFSGSQDKTVRLWNLHTGESEQQYSGNKRGVNAIAVSPDDQQLLTGGVSQDSFLRLWDRSSGKHPKRTIGMHGNEVTSVQFSPDGKFVLSGSEDKTVALRDVRTGQQLLRLRGHKMGVTSVAFSPDGRMITSGSGSILSKMAKAPADYSVKLWDIESGSCLRTFEGHRSYVRSVAFTPDGTCILSGSQDKTLRLWDVMSGECLKVLDGSEFGINDIAISPNGQYAVSASGLGGRGNILQLWNLSNGERVAVFEGHEDVIHTVAFSPQGGHILSGSKDQTVRLWTLDWELGDYLPADWDESARPYLENFLTLHNPFAGQLSQGRKPTEEEIKLALTRKGKPTWTEADFQSLLTELGRRGYGWLREDGVRQKLEELAAEREIYD